MDENPNITDFELLLKQQSISRPILYKDNTNQYTEPADNLALNAQVIISNVREQIKAIQNADSVKNYRKPTAIVNKCLMPLNKLQEQKRLPPPPEQKFETQLFSNTQLIGVVETVEAWNDNTGMTQEFDTTFFHGHIDDDVHNNQVEENPVFHILDISLKEPDGPIITKTEDENGEQIATSDETDNQVHQLHTYPNPTQILNECIKIEEIDPLNKQISQQHSSQRIPSPVFNVKTKKPKSDSSSSPIVCDLDAFENFEKIAVPVVKESQDIEQARHVINSQILSNELTLQPNVDNGSHNMNVYKLNLLDLKRSSPIIEMSEVPLRVDKELLLKNKKESTRTHDNNTNNDGVKSMKDFEESKSVDSSHSDKSVFKDEILFSSDEEDDYKQHSYKDLPFTCALETSFYDTCEVLDKTIGFQTASNKSIQIETESFSKAKSLLDSVEQELQNEATLTELVKIFDSCKNEEATIEDDNVKDNSKAIKYEENLDHLHDVILQKESSPYYMPSVTDKVPHKYESDATISEPTEDNNSNNLLRKALTNPYNKFNGFKTASNKMIQFSENSVEKSKKLFHDIDLVENLEFLVETPKNSEEGKEMSLEVSDRIDYNLEKILQEKSNQEMSEVQVNENQTIQESEDDLMDTELENIIQNLEQSKDSKAALSNERTEPFHDKVEFIGFKTASNKNIQISATALAKSKKVFQDIEKDEFKMDVVEDTNTHYDETDVIQINSLGFKTASNKLIKISKEAKTNTTHIFKDIDLYNDTNILKTKSEHQRDLTQPFTKENKKVKYVKNKEIHKKSEKIIEHIEIDISKKSVVDSKEILNNKDCEINSDDDLEPFYGFDNTEQYAQSVKETLLRSQKIIEKLSHDATEDKSSTTKISQDPESANNKAYDNNERISVSIGFRTASDKNIEISQEALGRSRKIFEDFTDDKTENVIASFDDNDNCNLKINFGFKTASNKEVKVSKNALAKSRKIFHDLNEFSEEAVSTNMNNEIQFKGFQTASNKQVNISKEALDRSRKIFQDINGDLCGDLNVRDINTKPIFKKFLTASNKKIEISEEALARSDKIFQDIDGSKTTDIRAKKSDFEEFRTASNEKVIISETALAKSRKIFEDVSENKQKKTENSNSDTIFKGFQTASYKKVKISAAALARSKKIFHDIDDALDEKLRNTKSGHTFQGFQTASNKAVKISAEALAKSKQLFRDIESDATTDLKTNFTIPKNYSFKTASNKDIKISEQALAKNRKLFEDFTEDDPVDTLSDYPYEEPNIINPVLKFRGFQTASNKQINISYEALAKSKTLFQEINADKTLEIASINEKPAPKFDGFKTASHKKVIISEEALAKSRKILDEVVDDKSKEFNAGSNKMHTGVQFKGFQTANNKNVAISEEAIARSRKMFQDVSFKRTDTSDIETHKTATFSKFDGFKTACNDKVQVSEEALMQSKKLLGDLNKVTKDSKTKIGLNQNIDSVDVIDTQILNNFEVSMHEYTPKKSKRSGSPILSCPKAKKRKVFQIPYSQKSPQKTITSNFKPPTVQKQESLYNFSLTYKKTKKYTLKDIQNLENTSTHSQEIVDEYIKKFDFENLLQIEFSETRNDVTNSVIPIPELKNIFLNSVNKKLIPDGWLEIQLKLILWKLISYEMKFPKTMSKICTARNVLEQLKYRYDKELYNAERPALRKIFERDDTSAKTLVLCVVDICKTEHTSDSIPELLLTDGWYIIRAVIDKMLARLVGSGKIIVGTKLVTNGAELVGSEQAVSPWEDTASIRLKIFGNSTRRARWDTRLGYRGNAAILSQLSTVALDGGKVSKLRAFVTRVYPTLYVDKFEDGSTVTRSERLEHIHQMKYENERQALLEKIYEEVEKEVLDQDLTDSEDVSESGGKRKCLDTGSQIAKIMKRSRDPGEFRSTLTSTQLNQLEDYTVKEREKLLQNIQAKVEDKMAALGLKNRNVVTLLKIRVAAVEKTKDAAKVTKALLSIWKPNDAVMELIREGIWLEVLNVVPTAMRYSELQISAGRQSIFSQLKCKEDDKIKPYIDSLTRTCHLIKDLVKNPAMTTDYNEIDTVGIIFEIDPKLEDFNPNIHQFQNIYLTDAEKNIISINFWGGLKKFGFENVLDTGQVVACTNLQKRAGNSRKNIPQYRVTEFSYFTKTPKSDAARKVIDELQQEFCKINKETFYQECVSLKNNHASKPQINDNVTPYRIPNVDINSFKNKIFIDSPLEQKNKKDENLNLTGLDFESTFRQTDTQELSPKTLLRKQQVKERISKLKRYGEPPPLSPMLILNKSKNAAHAFKSPLLSKSDVSNSVASGEKILPKWVENDKKLNIPIVSKSDVSNSVASSEKNLPNWEEKCNNDIVDSPVMCLNRTYVKRSNPVKLNFSKNENSLNEDVDGFDEEFDCSLPLSLD